MVSGTIDVGSIPSGGTTFLLFCLFLKGEIFLP